MLPAPTNHQKDTTAVKQHAQDRVRKSAFPLLATSATCPDAGRSGRKAWVELGGWNAVALARGIEEGPAARLTLKRRAYSAFRSSSLAYLGRLPRLVDEDMTYMVEDAIDDEECCSCMCEDCGTRQAS